MTARGTGVLLVALAALASWLWLTLVRPPAVEPPALLAEPATHVARVELDDRGARLAAVRRDGVWVDERGRPWRGDAVASLVEALGTLRPVMVVDPDPARPAEYGLDAGASVLRCVGDDGRSLLSLEIGEPNPAGTGVYARVTGERPVVLVGGLLRWELEKLRRAAPGTQP